MWLCSESSNSTFACAGENTPCNFSAFPAVDAWWGLWSQKKSLSAHPVGPVSVLQGVCSVIILYLYTWCMHRGQIKLLCSVRDIQLNEPLNEIMSECLFIPGSEKQSPGCVLRQDICHKGKTLVSYLLPTCGYLFPVPQGPRWLHFPFNPGISSFLQNLSICFLRETWRSGDSAEFTLLLPRSLTLLLTGSQLCPCCSRSRDGLWLRQPLFQQLLSVPRPFFLPSQCTRCSLHAFQCPFPSSFDQDDVSMWAPGCKDLSQEGLSDTCLVNLCGTWCVLLSFIRSRWLSSGRGALAFGLGRLCWRIWENNCICAVGQWGEWWNAKREVQPVAWHGLWERLADKQQGPRAARKGHGGS